MDTSTRIANSDLATVDPKALAAAKQLLRLIAIDFAEASAAAKLASEADPGEGWRHLQQVFARADAATQQLRDLRRLSDNLVVTRR